MGEKWVEVGEKWVEVGGRCVEVGGGGWRWVNGLVYPIIIAHVRQLLLPSLLNFMITE